jgi:hypothetical protein
MANSGRRTISEERQDLERYLRELEAGRGVDISDQFPATPEDRIRQIERLKELIRELRKAENDTQRLKE